MRSVTTRHVTSGAQQVDDPAIRLLRQAVSARAVCAHPMTTQAGALLVFDEGGITGHPDHRQATAAALFAAEREDLTVLAWACLLYTSPSPRDGLLSRM